MSLDCVIIDYGMGNLHSAEKALAFVAPPQLKVRVSSDTSLIRGADRVVLPGVGSIRDCVGQICRQGIDRLVGELIDRRVPLLGICVGMQALLSHSEENGGIACLGSFVGQVRKFNAKGDLRVPHMGWNRVRQSAPQHPLWSGISQDSRFYFVHSYYVELAQVSEQVGTTKHGIDFCAALARDSVFATQFHPEKSQADGLRLLSNFCRWTPC